MKTRVFIFLLGLLASGLIFAEEGGAFSSRTSTTDGAGFSLGYAKDQIAEQAIYERISDRFGLFDSSNNDQPSRYSVSLDVEKEDSDWSFEVTVTMEF